MYICKPEKVKCTKIYNKITINTDIQMTKSDIINEITLATGVQKKDVTAVVEGFMETIKTSLLEKKENHELDDLYKELPNVLNKFISIHPDYRTSLRNVEGKNPEELMQESLNNIERKLNEYLEDINLDKVSDLSIAQRVIKMKT